MKCINRAFEAARGGREVEAGGFRLKRELLRLIKAVEGL